MGRQPCCEKIGLKKGTWTVEEDHKLMSFILSNGIHCWRMVPKLAGLLRCGKSCRLRWINYLRPDLKRGTLSESEEDQIIQLHARLGNKWSKIAAHFPGRTDNEIKNHWNTRIKKRLKLLGLDPVTHMPIHQNHTTDEDNTVDTIPHPASSKQENETSDANSGVDHPTRAEEKQREVDLTFGESTVLLDDHDETLGAFDVGLWLNQENSIPKVWSPPVSVEDSLNPSAGESSSSFPEESLQQWINGEDSLLSWDGFNQLQEELFFMDHSNEHT